MVEDLDQIEGSLIIPTTKDRSAEAGTTGDPARIEENLLSNLYNAAQTRGGGPTDIDEKSRIFTMGMRGTGHENFL